MARYTASLTVALSPEIAEAVYQAALEDGVGPSVMGRKLIEDGLIEREFKLREFVLYLWVSRERCETPGMGYGFVDALSEEAFGKLREIAGELKWR